MEPTTACNARCHFCPVSIRDDSFEIHHLDDEVFDRVKKELSELPPDMEGYIQMVGLGEPTISKNFARNLRVLREVAPKNFEFRMNTNGTTLHSEKIAEALVQYIDTMTVSINGYDEESYLLMNGIPEFEKTLSNLKSFLRFKNHNGFRKPQTRVQIMNNKHYESEKYLSFKKDLRDLMLKPDRFHLRPLMTLATVEDQIDEIMSDADRIREETIDHSKTPCFQMRYNAYVCADGDVYPCCIVGNLDGEQNRRDTGLLIGNINESTLKEIWSGEKRKDLLRRDLSADRPEFCRNCSALSMYDVRHWRDLQKVAMGHRRPPESERIDYPEA